MLTLFLHSQLSTGFLDGAPHVCCYTVKLQTIYIVFVLPVILCFLPISFTFSSLLSLFLSFCSSSSLPPLQLFPSSSLLTAGLPCINAVPETGCQTKSCFVSSLATAVWWGPTAHDIGNKREKARCEQRQRWQEVYLSICAQPYVCVYMNIGCLTTLLLLMTESNQVQTVHDWHLFVICDSL